ncbi:MAG: glycosyltransferase family 10 [Lewinella sp.]
MQKYRCGFYNFWQTGPYEDFWLRRFLMRPRLRPLVGRKRIAFISVFGDPNIKAHLRADLRVFFTGENLDFYPSYSDHLFDEVDLSIGFDYLEREDYLRFPIWLLHCFEPEMDLSDISARLEQWKDNRANLLDRPSMVATMVASHDRSGVRGEIADEFANYGRVLYGGQFRNSGVEIGPGWPNKLDFIRRYPFQICPENSARDGYTTEKLFEAFAAGCVPIYSGSEQPPEPGIFCQDAIINYRPGDRHLFHQELERLSAGSSRLKELRDLSPFTPSAADHVHQYYIDLENRLVSLLR